MINLMVYGYNKDRIYKPKSKPFIPELFRIHFENSLHYGWKEKEIVYATNMELDFLKGTNSKLLEVDFTDLTNKHPSVCKWWGLLAAIKSYPNEDILYHDYDCFQVNQFVKPRVAEIGLARYNLGYNTGFVYTRYSGKDIVEHIIQKALSEFEILPDEAVVKRIDQNVKDRITEINSRYNLGRTKYKSRYERAIKPIMFIHVHLESKKRFIDWCERETVNGLIIPDHLKSLFRESIHKDL